MRTFLYYWKPTTVDYEIGEGSPLNHSASDQFGRVEIGDHVWHVTVRNGELSVIGRIIVGEIADQTRAAHLLGTDDLWEGSHHIIAVSGTGEHIREVRIPGLADSLRFDRPSPRDRLKLNNGLVNVQQLRRLRLLTPACAAELESDFRSMKNSQNSD